MAERETGGRTDAQTIQVRSLYFSSPSSPSHNCHTHTHPLVPSVVSIGRYENDFEEVNDNLYMLMARHNITGDFDQSCMK